MKYGEVIDSEEKIDLFLIKVPAWDIEQLACVNDYLFRPISVGKS